MGLYSGGLTIGRICASEIWGGLFSGGLIIYYYYYHYYYYYYYYYYLFIFFFGGGGGLIIEILRYVHVHREGGRVGGREGGREVVSLRQLCYSWASDMDY